MDEYDVLIVGCGLSGSVMANLFATKLNYKVLIIESREHIGGNCYDYIDEETGILMNKYGAHIFHTNDIEAWNYVNNFAKWIRYEHRVLADIGNNEFVPMPINGTTINMLTNENLQTESDIEEWLNNNKIDYNKSEILNSEGSVLSKVGPILYDTLFKNYTLKQWDLSPNLLDKSVLERIPIRTNFDNRYFTDKYQALPKNGYTKMFENMLNHPNIKILLNTNYFDFIKQSNYTQSNKKITIFTGRIDHFFSLSGYEPLKYRSLKFHKEIYNSKYYQPNSVINYTNKCVPYIRSVEYKHFLNQESSKTVVVYEYSKESISVDDAMYPIPTMSNIELYKKYKELTYKQKDVHFVGRLANYKYFNMDQAIRNAMDYFNTHFLK